MDKIELLFRMNNQLWNIGNSVLGLARIPMEIKTRKIRASNKELISYKKSSQCYIVGLGPSLKNVDFSKLDGDVIATNKYYKFDQNGCFPPTYLLLSDKSFFGGSTQDDFINSIQQYNDSCMVLNGIYRDWCEKQINNTAPEINRYYFYMWKGGIKRKRPIEFTRILPAVNNVVLTAIMLAIYCGYKKIYLLGCDFNSFASPVANHCYTDENTNRLWDIDFELYAYSLAANAHVALNKYAETHGIHIVNATKGSLLDAYPFDTDKMDRIYQV